MEKAKRIIRIIACIGILVIVSVSTILTFSYLASQSNELKNIFTIGKIEMELTELEMYNGVEGVYINDKNSSTMHVKREVFKFPNSIMNSNNSIYYLKNVYYWSRARYAMYDCTNKSGSVIDSITSKDTQTCIFPSTTGSYKARRTFSNIYNPVPGGEYWKDPTICIKQGSAPCYVFISVKKSITEDQESYSIDMQIKDNGWKLLTGVDNVDNVYYYVGQSEQKKKVVSDEGDQVLPIFNRFVVAKDWAQPTTAKATSDTKGTMVEDGTTSTTEKTAVAEGSPKTEKTLKTEAIKIQVGAIALSELEDVGDLYKKLWGEGFNKES